MPTSPKHIYILQEAEVGVGEGFTILLAADNFDRLASEAIQRGHQIKGSHPIVTWRALGPDHWCSNTVLGFQWDITKVEVLSSGVAGYITMPSSRAEAEAMNLISERYLQDNPAPKA